jgi:hypothetical protein
MKVARLIPILALVVGCSSVPTISELPTTYTFKFGQDVHLLDPDLTIRFVEVVQDSRCPVDVVCVQEGSALLRFAVIDPADNLSTVLIETGGPPQESQGLIFRLISVAPEPRSGQPLDPENYTATVEISQ